MSIEPHEWSLKIFWSFMDIDGYSCITCGFKYSIRRVIPAMAVPTIISMLVTSIYNVVDTYYVGLLNTQATAAVGVVFPVMAIIQSIGFLFGQGSGTYMSRHLGARRLDEARQMAATSFGGSVAVWVWSSPCWGLIFLTPPSIALPSTPTILPYTEHPRHPVGRSADDGLDGHQ